MATAVQINPPVTAPKATAVLPVATEDNGFALAFQSLVPDPAVPGDPAPAADPMAGALPEGEVPSEDAKTPPDPQTLLATMVLPLWKLTLVSHPASAPASPVGPVTTAAQDSTPPVPPPEIAAPSVTHQVPSPGAAAPQELRPTGGLPIPVLANPLPAPSPPAVVPPMPTAPDLPASQAPAAPPEATEVVAASGTLTQPASPAAALPEHKAKAVSKPPVDPAKAEQTSLTTPPRHVTDGAVAGAASASPTPMPTTMAPIDRPIGQTGVQSLFESRARDHSAADRGDPAATDLPPDAPRPPAALPTPVLAKPAASQPAVPGLVPEPASPDAQLLDPGQLFFPTALTSSPITPPTAIATPLAAVLPQILHLITTPSHRVTEVALAPEELGHVRLSLRAHDSDPDRIIVMMMFERPEAMDLFRRNADQLQADLRAAGYSGADLSFSHSGSGKPQDQPAPAPGPTPAGLTVTEPPPAVFASPGSRTSSASLDLRL